MWLENDVITPQGKLNWGRENNKTDLKERKNWENQLENKLNQQKIRVTFILQRQEIKNTPYLYEKGKLEAGIQDLDKESSLIKRECKMNDINPSSQNSSKQEKKRGTLKIKKEKKMFT